MPEMTTVALALPADGAVTGTVVITAAALPGGGLVEFTVSAVTTGGQPGTVYDLDGNDCSTTSPLGDHVWATGVTSAAGVADLVGYAWTGGVVRLRNCVRTAVTTPRRPAGREVSCLAAR